MKRSMKIFRMKEEKSGQPGWIATLVGVLTLVFALTFACPVVAQDWSEYEYEADEGLHEEEWYDPSDWFDADQGISFESDDWWDYGYGWGDYDTEYYGYDAYDGYGDDYFGVSPYYTDDDLGYTDQWYEDEGVFEGWNE